MDQAEELRRIVRKNNEMSAYKSTGCRIVTVSGGKGGVGKTSITANMAVALAKTGVRVGIFDADMGLANIDIMLGVFPKKNLADVLINGENIEDIILQCPQNVKLIPASSGIEELSYLSDALWNSLINQLYAACSQFDVLFIDTAAGIGKNVINFVLASQELILVTTPEPTALADTYAMIKIINKKMQARNVSILINKAEKEEEAVEVYKRFEKLITKSMSIVPTFLGWVPMDKNLGASIMKRQVVVNMMPQSPSSQAISSTAKKWYENVPPHGTTGNIKIYFKRVKNLMQKSAFTA